MSTKKIGTLLVAAMLTIGAVGATFAWFTSQDSVTNRFNVGLTDGIDIEETFDPPTGLVPGTNTEKIVWVKSTADYNQLLRVKFEKVWKDKAGNIVTHYSVAKDANDKETIIYYGVGDTIPGDAKPLSLDRIGLNFANFATEKGDTWHDTDGTLVSPEYGYYYYNQIFAPGASTSPLLESVDFVSAGFSDTDSITDTDNYYKNLQFDIIVTAESIASEGINAGNEDLNWENVPDYIYPVTP